MDKDELSKRYFQWMYQLVCEDGYTRGLSYEKLFLFLYKTPYKYSLAMDANRAEDGENLRYRFGHENSLKAAIIATNLDYKPCSMLEMMVALSIRCEEEIMEDSSMGNRVGQWFWEMIVSLRFGQMFDSNFDEIKAREIIDRFEKNDYASNGEGGLFTVQDSEKDLRKIEIWYQMWYYLNSNFNIYI